MRRVVVTVVGSRRRVNLALPAEPPIRDLVTSLVERCGETTSGAAGGDGPRTWVLATSDTRELPAERSLDDCGVHDGAIVYLRTTTVAAHGTPRDRRASSSRSPLPQRLGLPGRLFTAAAAFAGNAGSAGERRAHADGAGGSAGTVAELTARPQLSPVARARRAWAHSAYPVQLDAAIRAPRLKRCITIAAMSPKGGVGKTTTAVLAGSLLAALRSDRVVAVDTNPDHGSLGRSLTPGHTTFVDDLLYMFQTPALTATALDGSLGRGPHGLMVLPAPTDPARMARLDEDSYTRVIRRLQAMVGVVVLDCGTGLQEPGALAALKCADVVVLVTDAEPATASIVVEAAQLLARAHRPIILVVNKMPARGARLSMDALLPRASVARNVVVVPREVEAASRLAAGDIDWSDAPNGWRIALRELAVVILDCCAELGLVV